MAVSSRYNTDQLHQEAIELLSALIETPSLSKSEDKSADLIQDHLEQNGIATYRKGNNVWAKNLEFDETKPSILLNSHHDTVRPNRGYTNDPYHAILEDDKLFGLGSNDAGGALVSLMMTFKYYYHHKGLPYNLIMAATAEEEISGPGGIASIIEDIGPIDFAIVGEPTEMEMAIHEKGLMVLDCISKGEAGHAAREEGVNAIYQAIKDIEWFQHYQFPKVSETLGPVKMSVTMIEAGTQHNVVPDHCHFVVDVRTTDAYSNEETLEIIRSNVKCECRERSTRLQPSRIDNDHPIVKAAQALDISLFGSTTLSDQSLIPYASVKIGPGKSARSHSPNEYIEIEEIKEGIMGYLMLLNRLFKG